MIRSGICGGKPHFSSFWFTLNKLPLASHSDAYFRIRCPLYYYSSTVSRSRTPRHPVADYLIGRYGFSPKIAAKVSSQVPHLESLERSDLNLNWLKDTGFSQTQLEIAVSRAPQLLMADLDKTLKPKYQIFRDLGFPPTDAAELFAVDPWLLSSRAADRLSMSILALKRVLGSVEDVSRVLKICTWFLKADLEKTLLVNIDFLEKRCGVSPLQIRRFIFNFPRFFLNQPEFIRGVVRRVDEMGFGDRNSGMFMHAVRAMASLKLENWQAKLKLFRSLGFSEEDISSVFRRAPQVFATSDRKIREAIDVLLSSRNSNLSLIVRHPGLLLFSAEHRIKPRMLVLDVLEAKKLIRKRPSLATLCKLSNRQFLGKYVLPYSDVVGKTYMVDKYQ